MAEAKYKVGDDVAIFFFENCCLEFERFHDDYWVKRCPVPFRGTVRSVNNHRSQSAGALYAIEFLEKDVSDIMAILKENPSKDAMLHDCDNIISSRRGRWILEDAIRLYSDVKKTMPPAVRINILRRLLVSQEDRKEAGTI